MHKGAILRILTCALACYVALFANSVAYSADKESLYKRIGGDKAVSAVTDGFVNGMLGDPKLKRYFEGANIPTMRKNMRDQLCAFCAGGCKYSGKDMYTAHKHLRLTSEDWNAIVKNFVEAVDRAGIKGKERDELLPFVDQQKVKLIAR